MRAQPVVSRNGNMLRPICSVTPPSAASPTRHTQQTFVHSCVCLVSRSLSPATNRGGPGRPNDRNTFSLCALVSMATLTKTPQQMSGAPLSRLVGRAVLTANPSLIAPHIGFHRFKAAPAKSRSRRSVRRRLCIQWRAGNVGINRGNDPDVTFIMKLVRLVKRAPGAKMQKR